MKALKDCHSDVIDVYGYGIQVITALDAWHKQLRELISSGQVDNLNRSVALGLDSPDDPALTFQYKRPIGYILKASSTSGTTLVIHRRGMVTLLHSTWEERHRDLIAKELGFKHKKDFRRKNNIKSDVFSDINKYRQAIIHTGGKLDKNPKVFRFFRKGEVVSLTNEHVEIIFRSAVDELNRIGRDYYGTDPQFSFDQPLIPGMPTRPRSIKPGDILEGSPAYLVHDIGRSDSSRKD